MSKRLVGGIKGCKYKTSSWYIINRFPDADNIDWVNSIMSGRSPPLYCTFTLIAMQGHYKSIKNKPETKQYTITHGSSNIHYKGYKYKATTTTWYLNGFPLVIVTLGQQYNFGEKPSAILYTYINHHAQPPIIPQHNHSNT